MRLFKTCLIALLMAFTYESGLLSAAYAKASSLGAGALLIGAFGAIALAWTIAANKFESELRGKRSRVITPTQPVSQAIPMEDRVKSYEWNDPVPLPRDYDTPTYLRRKRGSDYALPAPIPEEAEQPATVGEPQAMQVPERGTSIVI